MRHVNVRITIVALVKVVRSLNFFKLCWRISCPWTSKGFFVIVVLRTIGLVVFDVNWKWLIKVADVIVEVKDESVVVRMMTKKNNRCDRIESISSLFRRTMMIHFVTGERTNDTEGQKTEKPLGWQWWKINRENNNQLRSMTSNLFSLRIYCSSKNANDILFSLCFSSIDRINMRRKKRAKKRNDFLLNFISIKKRDSN